jgi:hypothetical protein
MIRNISDTGAMFDMTKPAEVSEQFTLAWKQLFGFVRSPSLEAALWLRSLARAPEL